MHESVITISADKLSDCSSLSLLRLFVEYYTLSVNYGTRTRLT